jgi:hypothetical protein
MTTGRINQVTTFQNHFRGRRLLTASRGALSAFTTWSSSTFVRIEHSRPTAACRRLPPTGGGTSDLRPADGATLFPVLTRLEQDPLVPWRDKGHRP